MGISPFLFSGTGGPEIAPAQNGCHLAVTSMGVLLDTNVV